MENLNIELNVDIADSSAAIFEDFDFDLICGDQIIIMEFITN